ncbi:hypothetical protein FHS09_002409 [Microbulbifer rhizosphaerae]|uniref:Uncharacterized protein n=1 Tax=Microbulbifer rhizosphaerae TaxID=1562603 RepID=A0A7W4Z9H1_9GAMM|nr:hypothetical protein [Microbulbifer rhizosphaerae]
MSKASVFRLVIAIALTFSANAYANQNTGKVKITFLENWVAVKAYTLKPIKVASLIPQVVPLLPATICLQMHRI